MIDVVGEIFGKTVVRTIEFGVDSLVGETGIIIGRPKVRIAQRCECGSAHVVRTCDNCDMPLCVNCTVDYGNIALCYDCGGDYSK